MKRTLNRSFIVLIVALAFIGGIGVFCVRLGMGCSDWVQKPYNGHIAGSGGLAQAGKILDRDGNILAQTIDGERVYSDDYNTRMALLHTVGDDSLNISTAVQSRFRSELTNYSFVWGLGLPESMKRGSNITLTVDSSACAAAYSVLGDRTGACFVYNYKTGEVLCSVSTKTYDPADPPEITEENEEQYDGVYLDHALSSSFTPGSTFKIVTAAAAIENLEDAYDFEVYCEGSAIVGGNEITCTGAHGQVDINDAFTHSCNIFFANLAVKVGAENMQKTAEKLGFNKQFSIDGIPLEQSTYNAVGADENQLAWSGAGQYTDLANPAHMAIVCAAIASGGTPVMPYIIDDASWFSDKSAETGDRMMSESTAAAIKQLMRGAVENNYGDYMFGGLTAYAKSGTAETGDGEPTAWMVGFTSDEDMPIAFAAVIEHGGSGASAAGELVSAVLSDLNGN